ncbi:MAG: hypothetical protein DMF68_20840 [Acidobacteria bacterium]|nr:MAG: hypothetical protein DMF68_20840 [Acidobacteriota bacterium]
MTKSEFVLAVDKVQEPVTTLLRARGFTKSGRTYNRTADDGLIYVVNFQMGSYPISRYVIPGLRESLYGQFAVNLGVYLPCVAAITQSPKPKRTYQDYHCEIRERLGSLANSGKDVWWNTSEPPELLGQLITELVVTFGLPFLETFNSYSDVLNYYDGHGTLPFHNEGRSSLAAAIICYHLGERAKSQALFERAADYATRGNHIEFHDYVREIQQRCVKNGDA